MFSGRYIRTVLLSTSRRDNRGSFPRFDRVTDFHPGQFLDPNAVERGDRARRLRVQSSTPLGRKSTCQNKRKRDVSQNLELHAYPPEDVSAKTERFYRSLDLRLQIKTT